MLDENRNIPRITAECPMTYHNVDSPNIKTATALDVSNNGILFLTDEKLPDGCLKEIHIQPTENFTVALNAIIQVVRIEPADEASTQFKIAGVIKIIK